MRTRVGRLGPPLLLSLGTALLLQSSDLGARPLVREGGRATSALAVRAPSRKMSRSDRRALLAGETVARPLRFRQGGGQYVGGVAYQLVEASPPEVLTALLSVQELPRLLPRTKQARLVDSQGGRTRIELVQGNSLVEATYTVVLEQTEEGLLRFWLDPSRPHDIRDVWGYFRVRPFDAARSLFTMAVALDVGDPLVRLLFEDRIQQAILNAPRKMRDYLAPEVVAAAP